MSAIAAYVCLSPLYVSVTSPSTPLSMGRETIAGWCNIFVDEIGSSTLFFRKFLTRITAPRAPNVPMMTADMRATVGGNPKLVTSIPENPKIVMKPVTAMNPSPLLSNRSKIPSSNTAMMSNTRPMIPMIKNGFVKRVDSSVVNKRVLDETLMYLMDEFFAMKDNDLP